MDFPTKAKVARHRVVRILRHVHPMASVAFRFRFLLLLFRDVEAFLCNFFHHRATHRAFVELPPDSDESG